MLLVNKGVQPGFLSVNFVIMYLYVTKSQKFKLKCSMLRLPFLVFDLSKFSNTALHRSLFLWG